MSDEIKVTISRKELKAALLFAGQNDSRYVLNGIKVECSKTKAPILIAADGRKLAVIGSESPQNSPQVAGEFIIGRDFATACISMSNFFGGVKFPAIEFTTNDSERWLKADFICAKASVTSDEGRISGNFPNWKQIVPKKDLKRVPAGHLGINPVYLTPFIKAAEIFGKDANGILMQMADGGKAPIEINLIKVKNFYGVLMPLVIDDLETRDYQPEFIK